MSVNKVILIGNLGKDPEIRSTQSGKDIASFSLATTESWKDKASGEKKQMTDWHNVVVFNVGLVNLIKQYVKKGTKLYLEGALKTRKWQDKQGNDKYTTEVVLSDYKSTITLLGSSEKQATKTVAEQTKEYNDKDLSMVEDDIPF